MTTTPCFELMYLINCNWFLILLKVQVQLALAGLALLVPSSILLPVLHAVHVVPQRVVQMNRTIHWRLRVQQAQPVELYNDKRVYLWSPEESVMRNKPRSSGITLPSTVKMYVQYHLCPFSGDFDPQMGYSGFQVTGMIKGFFWVWKFDSGIFLGRKIWQVFFWLAWFK